MIADFIAIDFETASRDMDSACSIGIVAVKDLCVSEKFYSLIKPKTMLFEESNISVHGITPDMVETAPTMDELWPKVANFFSEHVPVVAHNAGFDMSVLKNLLNLELPDFYYVDTMHMASPLVEGSKSLAHCAECMEIPLENHHNALDDAWACAQIAIGAISADGCITLWEYLAKNGLDDYARRFSDLKAPKVINAHGIEPRKHFEKVSPKEIQRSVKEVDTNCPLCNTAIVFTGELSISRREAMQIAVNCGAVVRTSVSKKTNYLVVGKQDKEIVGEDGLSTKEEKAYALIDAGVASIKIIDEEEFLTMAGIGVTI